MGGEMSKQGSHAQKCMQARWVMSVVLAMNQRPSAWMKGWLLFSASPFVPCGNTGPDLARCPDFSGETREMDFYVSFPDF